MIDLPHPQVHPDIQADIQTDRYTGTYTDCIRAVTGLQCFFNFQRRQRQTTDTWRVTVTISSEEHNKESRDNAMLNVSASLKTVHYSSIIDSLLIHVCVCAISESGIILTQSVSLGIAAE